MKKKKKGFTLVEMLVTLVIIGVLALIVVPQVSRLLGKGKEIYYTTMEKEVELLAQDYYATNRKELPVAVNDTNILTAGIMVKNGYINEMFRDANNEACNNTFAAITKEGNQKYDYIACLMCDDYETENETCQELKKEAGYVNKIKHRHQVLMPIDDDEKNEIKDKIIATTGVTRSDIELDLSQVNVNVLSGVGEYRFIYSIESKDIYGYEGLVQVVDEVSPTIVGEDIYTIKDEAVNILDSLTITDNYYQESEITIGIVEIDQVALSTPGSYTVRVSATDPSGNTSHKDLEIIVFEKIVTFSPDGQVWTNQTITTTIALTNIAGLTPTSWEYKTGKLTTGETTWQASMTGVGNSMSHELSDTGVYLIEVNVTYDNGETYTQTSKQFKIDKSIPQCGTIIGSSTTWTNSDRTVSIGCTGSISGCTANSYSKTYSTTSKEGTITISNTAGTSNSCSVNVYVDKTKPECGTITEVPANASMSNWTNNQRQVNVSCSDADSDCSINTFTETFNITTTTSSIVISDNAGNSKSCPVDVYVDKSTPAAPVITGTTSSGAWTTTSNQLTIGTVTSPSQIASYKYCESATNSSAGCSWNSASTYNSSNKPTYNTNTIKYVFARAINNAGTMGTISPVFVVKVDKTAPTCTLKVTGSGVEFNAKTDDYPSGSTVSYGMNKTGTISYNNTSILSLAASTFYGYVKDDAGNATSCSATVSKTINRKHTCNTGFEWFVDLNIKCTASNYNSLVDACGSYANYSYDSDNCSRSATGKYSCRYNTSYPTLDKCEDKCNGTCSLYATNYSCYKNNLSCTSSNPSCGSGWTLLSGDTCGYTYSGTINCKTYGCPTGAASGTSCYLYEQSSCPSSWTSSVTSGQCPSGTTKLSKYWCYVIQ